MHFVSSNMDLGRVEGALTKCLHSPNDVFLAFMDIKKDYDTIDRHGMWQMLRVYGVG